MHILLTNDDGVNAPGLLALVEPLSTFGRVSVIAPHKNWSASGHVKTMHRPLRVWETRLADGTIALTTDGAPSDCVALGILGMLEDPIDMVVSGINPNANIGHDLTYSSTVMAAMEAAIAGILGFAISLDSPQKHNEPLDYAPSAEVAKVLIRQVIQKDLSSPLLLNVNVPYAPLNDIRGIKITRQGKRIYHDELERRIDPRGENYYWIGGDSPTGVAEPGTDFWALTEKFVSITPLRLDLTAEEHLLSFEAWNLLLS